MPEASDIPKPPLAPVLSDFDSEWDSIDSEIIVFAPDRDKADSGPLKLDKRIFDKWWVGV